MSALANTVTVLNAAARMDASVAGDLEMLTQECVERFTADLGIAGIDVVLTTEYTYLPIQELAVGGYAPSAGLVVIAVEPENPEFINWRTNLPGTVAHELNHAARWRSVGYGSTLLEALVSEGLATVYESLMTGHTPPYAKARADFNELWAEAAPLLHTTGYGHATWFFGEGHLPRWAGYGLGNELVLKHLKAAQISIQEATQLPASAFLDHLPQARPAA